MGNVQGYVKIKDTNDSSIHLIKANKLHQRRNGEWSDKCVYNFQENKFGLIQNGKFIEYKTINIHGLGEVYFFDVKGEVELYVERWLLKELRNAAVKYIEDSITPGKRYDVATP